MFTGININATKVYVSPNDPDKKNPTKFHLGALDNFIFAHIEDSSTVYLKDDIKICFAKRNLLLVKFGVRKIENYREAPGAEPVTIDADHVVVDGEKYLALSYKVLQVFPAGGIGTELATEIGALNNLSEQERKN